MILDRIVETKKEELAAALRALPLVSLRREAEGRPRGMDFFQALQGTRGKRVNLIAEVKKASPSKGLIRPDFDPVAIAQAYQQAGAQAISVLTDVQYFQGSPEYLKAVRQAVDLPILRKDFVIDPYQIFEAKAWGADAILLIAAILERGQIADYQALAKELGLTALVEVHDAGELEKALYIDAPLIGINNRNLQTFTTDLNTTFRLKAIAPPEQVLISESAIASVDDVARLKAAEIDAMLVGETFMRVDDIAGKVREFLEA